MSHHIPKQLIYYSKIRFLYEKVRDEHERKKDKENNKRTRKTPGRINQSQDDAPCIRGDSIKKSNHQMGTDSIIC